MRIFGKCRHARMNESSQSGWSWCSMATVIVLRNTKKITPQ